MHDSRVLLFVMPHNISRRCPQAFAQIFLIAIGSTRASITLATCSVLTIDCWTSQQNLARRRNPAENIELLVQDVCVCVCVCVCVRVCKL